MKLIVRGANFATGDRLAMIAKEVMIFASVTLENDHAAPLLAGENTLDTIRRLGWGSLTGCCQLRGVVASKGMSVSRESRAAPGRW
mgnify:CR=1 FL=1